MSFIIMPREKIYAAPELVIRVTIKQKYAPVLFIYIHISIYI